MLMEIEIRLYQRKVDVLLDQAPVAISAGTIAAFICTLMFWQLTDQTFIACWFLAYLTLFLLRYVRISRFNSTELDSRNHRKALQIHLAFSVIVGLLWSTIGIYLLSTLPLNDSVLVLLMIGGMVAGVVATNCVILSAYFAVCLPTALPVIIYLLLDPTPRTGLTGLVLGIFLVFMSFSAYRLNKLVVKSLSFQFDNLQLLGELEKKKTHVTRLYNDLESYLARGKKTEEQLKIEKEKAEQLAQSLFAISTLDGLTGIPNRRHFDSAIAKEWNRASRTGTPVSLIMCDIDYFKAYNDNYGHQKGDNCLIRLALLLQEHARREGDIAARYGGEEFVILLPATSLDNARDIAEQMRLAIEELSIPHRFSSPENIVTGSFGVATVIPIPDQQSGILISRADKALYRAKQQGRNQVVTATPGLYTGKNRGEEEDYT